MGNHTAGKAMGLMAEGLVKARQPGQSAMDLLDVICGCWRGCDAEFEASDPDRPTQIHPDYPRYTDPPAALGKLMIEAFAPPGKTYDFSPEHLGGDEDPDVVDRWWDDVYDPFRARYGFT